MSKRGAQRLESVESEQEALRALWEAFGRHQERGRAQREAAPPLSDEELLRMRIEESRDDVGPLTRLFLSTAVPLWIDRVRFWRSDYRVQKAHEIGEELAASHALVADSNPEGRVSQAERGKVAGSFNLLAQGLALLAFCPGGIVFAGHHWEVPSQGEPA